MSEQVTERRALIPYAVSYPAQVQAAGRQLAIAAQLNQDLERGRLVAILKRMYSVETVFFLSIRQAVDGDLIGRFADCWFWGVRWGNEGLSGNKALPWSPDLIERFADRWEWWWLSQNTALPWSSDLIERFADRWEWSALSWNKALPWSPDLIERFANRWEWGVGWDNQGLSQNTALPWSPDLIERFADRWEWGVGGDNQGLSGNKALPWSPDVGADVKPVPNSRHESGV
jgi:hypothetical protein